MNINKRGKVIVISGPSGVGKTTLYKKILVDYQHKIEFSISATTRPPRPGEQNEKDYYFLSEEQFKSHIDKHDFVEWAKVHNHYYGTLTSEVERIVFNGKACLLDVDVQGGMSIRGILPEPESCLIFIAPPSLEILEKRLRQRNTDSEDVLKTRIENAKKEMSFASKYDYRIINDDLDKAIQDLKTILDRIL